MYDKIYPKVSLYHTRIINLLREMFQINKKIVNLFPLSPYRMGNKVLQGGNVYYKKSTPPKIQESLEYL